MEHLQGLHLLGPLTTLLFRDAIGQALPTGLASGEVRMWQTCQVIKSSVTLKLCAVCDPLVRAHNLLGVGLHAAELRLQPEQQ